MIGDFGFFLLLFLRRFRDFEILFRFFVVDDEEDNNTSNKKDMPLLNKYEFIIFFIFFKI